MTAASVILVCNLLTMHKLPLPMMWIVCVIAGCAKIQGTFECMSNIQLWMTPMACHQGGSVSLFFFLLLYWNHFDICAVDHPNRIVFVF